RCANRKSRASRKGDADMLSPPLRAVPPDRTVRRRGSGLLQPLPDAAALMAQLYAVSVCHYEAPVTPLRGGRLLRSARNDRGCCHCEERSAAAIPDGAKVRETAPLLAMTGDAVIARSAATRQSRTAPQLERLLRCARKDTVFSRSISLRSRRYGSARRPRARVGRAAGARRSATTRRAGFRGFRRAHRRPA